MNMPFTNSIALAATVILVLVATVTDLRSRRIPNRLVVPFLVLGCVSSAIAHGWSGLGQSLLGILVAASVMGLLCFLGGMGMGDMKLCAAVGAWIGPSQLLIALVMTTLTGGVMAVGWAIAGGFLKETLRGSAALVAGRRKGLNLASPGARKMPYAPAIALGTLLSFLSN